MSTDRPAPRASMKLILLGAFALGLLALAWLGVGGRKTGEDGKPQPGSADEHSTSEGEPRSKSAQSSEAEATTASGRITSADGRGIADAVVTLAPLDGDERTPITTRSDAGGGWSLAGLAPGRYVLSASAAGFLAGLAPAITLRPGDNVGLDLRLEPGGNLLSGVVSDATGGVIEGALITVTPQSGILSMRERDSVFTLTDAEGRYALQLPDGRHRVRASHLDYASEQVVLELAGSAAQRDFSLVPTAVIEGIVRRESDGQPVAHAEVAWSREREELLPGGRRISVRERGGRVLADAQGRFRVRGLPPGVVELSARASQLASEIGVEVPVGIAERVEGVELWLAAAEDLRGRVVSAADGAAIEGAQVELLDAGLGTTTDAEGQFVIHGVSPGGHDLLASADGYRMRPSERVEVGEVDDIEIELERGLMIRGRVEPAALTEVAIELRAENMRMGGGMFMISGLEAVTSDAETGEFELGPVEPGRYTLTARAADGRGGTVEVEVGADGADGVVIPLEQRATLAGVVQDQNGQVVADVSVRARKQDSGQGSLSVVVNGRELTAASSPTSLEGRFEIAGLAAGTWIVEVVDAQNEALSTGAGPTTVVLEDGRREELTLRVETRDGTIGGIVRDADGHAVADAWVSAAFMPAAIESQPGPDGPGARAQMRMVVADDGGGIGGPAPTLPPVLTDGEGRFRFARLRRGEYLLTAELDGGTSKATLERVQPDAEVTLELAPLGNLEGRVLSNGEPADCTVRITGPTQRRARVRDGRFEVARLEPGRYGVEASAGDGSTSTTVTIEAGVTAEVELALERFSTITGKVVDASGQPIARAELLVGSGEGGRVEITREHGDPQYFTKDDGSFEIHAAAGNRVLIVQSPTAPMPLAIKPLVVEAGKDIELGEIREQKLEGMIQGGPDEGPGAEVEEAH